MSRKALPPMPPGRGEEMSIGSASLGSMSPTTIDGHGGPVPHFDPSEASLGGGSGHGGGSGSGSGSGGARKNRRKTQAQRWSQAIMPGNPLHGKLTNKGQGHGQGHGQGNRTNGGLDAGPSVVTMGDSTTLFGSSMMDDTIPNSGRRSAPADLQGGGGLGGFGSMHDSTGRRTSAPIYTPLMKAAAAGDEETVLSILEDKSLDLFVADEKGRTALDWARIARKDEVATILQECMGDEIDARRFKLEAKRRRDELQSMVTRNTRARRALIQSVDDRRPESVAELLRVTREVKEGVGALTRSSFNHAIKAVLRRSERSGEEGQFWLDMETDTGGTALILACSVGDLPLIKLLLSPEHEIRLDHETQRGHTALTWSCVCGHVDAVTLLLDAGSNLRRPTQYESRTALHHAAFHQHAPVVQVLLDRAMSLALHEKYQAETGIAHMTAKEKEFHERNWLKVYENFVRTCDRFNQTALQVAEDQVGNDEVVALFTAAESRIHNREWQLEQLDALGKRTECAQGCGYATRADKIEFHEVNECPKRILGCYQCGQQMPADVIQQHSDEQCPMRYLGCKFLPRGCCERIYAKDVEQHEVHRCPYRDVPCRVGCGKVMMYRSRVEHEMEKCPDRMIQCKQGCPLDLMAKEMRAHMKSDCVKRLVRCRVGCGELLPYDELDAHEQNVCIQPCQWEGCGKRIGPEDTRECHEMFLCERRIVKCPLGCGVVGLCAEHRSAHVAYQCPKRPVPCRFGCGKTIEFAQVSAHEASDGGDCPERLVHCPNDVVGRRLKVQTGPGVYEFATVKAYRKQPPPGWVVKAITDGSDDHQEELEAHGNGYFKLIYAKSVKWERLKDLSYVFIDRAGWTCGWISASALYDHVTKDCVLRSRLCVLGCGQSITLKGTAHHESAMCPKRMHDCRRGCGEVMAYEELESHENGSCVERVIGCDGCGEEIRSVDMEHHVKQKCPMAPVRCLYGCGESMHRGRLDNHMAHYCPKRTVECTKCGLNDLWAEELSLHTDMECPKRIVECPLCGENMEASYLPPHMSDICTKRIVECECGEAMKYELLADHKILDCAGFLRFCPLGCGMKVRKVDMKKHQFEECTKRNNQHQKLIHCPLGCGKEIAFHEQFSHLTTACPKRIMECPIGCGMIVPARSMDEHKLVCDRRIAPCGANCPSCARQLKSWVIPMVEIDRAGLATKLNNIDATIRKLELQAASVRSDIQIMPKVEEFRLQQDLARINNIIAGHAGERGAVLDEQRQLDQYVIQEGAKALKLQLVQCEEHTSTALIRAAASNELVLVEHLLELIRCSGGDQNDVESAINTESREGHTALTRASAHGHHQIVSALIKAGADVNYETSNGRTALIETAKHGHVEVTKYLILEGAVMNHVSSQRATAFDWAANSGSPEVLRELVREYRVQKDLRRLFLLILGGKVAEVNKIIYDGEKYRMNHTAVLEGESRDIDHEIAQTEKELEENQDDMAEREPRLFSMRADYAARQAEVEEIEKEADTYGEQKAQVMDDIYEDFEKAMLYLQEVDRGDIQEMLSLDTKNVPPPVRRVCTAVCLLFRLHPQHQENRLASRLSSRGMSRGTTPHTPGIGAMNRAALSRNSSRPNTNTGMLPGPDGMDVDYWPTAQKFFHEQGLIAKLRYFNKSTIDPGSIMIIKRDLMPGPNNDGQGLVYHGDDDEDGDVEADEGYRMAIALSLWVVAMLDYYEAVQKHQEMEQMELDKRIEHDDALPKLKHQLSVLNLEEFRCRLLHKEIDDGAKRLEYLVRKSGAWEEKLRASKIFQAVSQTGHTLMSWACVVGLPEMVELLLDHGAAPGFPDKFLGMCAIVIQKVYRHYRWLSTRGPVTRDVAAAWRERALGHGMVLGGMLRKCTSFRQHHRLPLTEAMYNGNHRLIGVFEQKKVPFYHAARTWVLPDPPPPFNRDHPLAPATIHNMLKEPMNMLECAELGAKERGSAEYLHKTGWVDTDAPTNMWSRTIKAATKAWGGVSEVVEAGTKERLRRQRVRETREKLAKLHKLLDQELSAGVCDYDKIISTVKEGAPIDYETTNGMTPLIRAAEEDVNAVGYVAVVNEDGDEVLAVEMLLDRPTKRPKIAHENKNGHTALSWATIKDRTRQMEALIIRGAEVNYQDSKLGRTPLIWAVTVGKHRAARLLLESGANASLKDKSGKTAIEWSKEAGYSECIGILLQFEQGNAGIAKGERGTAVERVPCSWGCGLLADRHTLMLHESSSCPRRIVVCKNGCGIEGLQQHEQEHHQTELCPERDVDCPLKCGEVLRATRLEDHVEHQCTMRQVDCQLGCGSTIRFKAMALHVLKDCPHRLASCKYVCNLDVMVKNMSNHTRNECPNRMTRCRVSCGLTMAARLRPDHEQNTCDMRTVTCKWLCGTPLLAKSLHEHENEKCEKRLVECPNRCGQQVVYEDKKEHLKNECIRRFIPCPKKCKVKIRMNEKDDHIANECGMRKIQCLNGCGQTILAMQQDVHGQHECTHRSIICSVCAEPVLSKDLKHHKEWSCPLRVVDCPHRGCYKRLALRDMKQHTDYDCRKRMVFCLQGCGMEMYADKRKGHHEKYCEMRFTPCPLGCGKSIRESAKMHHISLECIRRFQNN